MYKARRDYHCNSIYHGVLLVDRCVVCHLRKKLTISNFEISSFTIISQYSTSRGAATNTQRWTTRQSDTALILVVEHYWKVFILAQQARKKSCKYPKLQLDNLTVEFFTNSPVTLGFYDFFYVFSFSSFLLLHLFPFDFIVRLFLGIDSYNCKPSEERYSTGLWSDYRVVSIHFLGGFKTQETRH